MGLEGKYIALKLDKVVISDIAYVNDFKCIRV